MVDHINNGEEGYSVRGKLNEVIDRTNTLNGIENQVESNKNLSQQNKARIDDLQTEVDGKADKGHGHEIADVNGLQDILDNKQPSGDYVTEAPADGYQYGRQFQGGVMTWTVNEGGAGGAGAGMIISAEPPAVEDRQPGLQWMNENTGDIWIWDGVRWLEFPASGQIGPQGEKGDKGDKGDPGDGADVDLSAYSTTAEADAKYQPKGDYLTDFTELDPTVPQHVKGITTTNISHWDQAWDEATEANGWGNHAEAGYLKAGDIPAGLWSDISSETGNNTIERFGDEVWVTQFKDNDVFIGTKIGNGVETTGDVTAGNATFSGSVEVASLAVNGEPIGDWYTKEEADAAFEAKGTVVILTQAEYDGLTPNPNTVYFIK